MSPASGCPGHQTSDQVPTVRARTPHDERTPGTMTDQQPHSSVVEKLDDPNSANGESPATPTDRHAGTPQAAEAQIGFTLWFTGLSGAGKSTISQLVERELRRRGLRVEVLDGDVVRTHLSKGLGFSKEDRDTNIRRIGFVSSLLSRHGVAVLVAA